MTLAEELRVLAFEPAVAIEDAEIWASRRYHLIDLAARAELAHAFLVWIASGESGCAWMAGHADEGARRYNEALAALGFGV